MKNWALLLGVIFLASSCSSLSEEDCKSGDWIAIGKEDGLKGHNKDRLETHQKACSEYGITIDSNQYHKARKKGLITYCSRTGEKNGKEGKEDLTPKVCQDSSSYKTSFKKGYNEFCYAKGVKAGQSANKKSSPEKCLENPRFNKGWNKGIANYCTPKKASALGKKARPHNAQKCPAPLKEKFLKAYDKGIASYCTKAKGFKFGQQEKDIDLNVCPTKYREGFSFGFKKGIEYRNIKNKISALESEISELEAKAKDANASADLKAYLQKEIGNRQGQKEELMKQSYRIEGAVGV